MKNFRLARHEDYLKILESCKLKNGEYMKQAGKVKNAISDYNRKEVKEDNGHIWHNSPYSASFEIWCHWDNTKPVKLLFKIYWRNNDRSMGSDQFLNILKDNPVETLIKQVKDIIEREKEENKLTENGTKRKDGRKSAKEDAIRTVKEYIEKYKEYGKEQESYIEQSKGMEDVLKHIEAFKI